MTNKLDGGAQGAGRLCMAFAGSRRVAAGPLSVVAREVKRAVEGGEAGPMLVVDAVTSETVELDLRGTLVEVEGRYAEPAAPKEEVRQGPGRPRLGVVAKEITLLPRHWEWLTGQPGGASATLRRMVEEARRANAAEDAKRQSRDAAYRFATVMAGDEPGYEEAMRALFAGDGERFETHTRPWPPDVKDHARQLAAPAFGG